MKKIFTIIFLCTLVCTGFAQTAGKPLLSDPTGLPMRSHNLELAKARPLQAKTTSGSTYVFDTSVWTHLVDSTWGAGLPGDQKMAVFNAYWHDLDSAYACFINLPAYNWDSEAVAIDSAATSGISRGRFASVINKFMQWVNDGHSHFYDDTVNFPATIYKGLPVFRGESGLLGACVTTYQDTLALVYSAHADQPFGLQAGDIILGYNNIPWTTLVHTMLSSWLPNSVYKGSTDTATMHRYIQAAAENWYLFDTINIRKCDGSLVNLPTSLMNGVYYEDFCTEQMPVAGIYKLSFYDYYYGHISQSFGVISGTHIGYVYLYDCADMTGDNLYNAVKTLVEDSAVNGLIIDIRTNYGGSFLAFEKAFQYLNNGDASWVGYGDRYDTNRLNLENTGFPGWYDVTDNDPNYFVNPVAMLCGPNAISAGDFMPVLFKHDMDVRLFGKSTAGAFGAYQPVTLPGTTYIASRQAVNFFQVGSDTSYLSHTSLPVDQPVWFDKDSVCRGVDNVVTTAVTWINGIVSVGTPATTISQVRLYPNPAVNYVDISLSVPQAMPLHIELRNTLGQLEKTITYDATAGANVVQMNIAGLHLSPGNYSVTISAPDGTRSVRRIAVMN